VHLEIEFSSQISSELASGALSLLSITMRRRTLYAVAVLVTGYAVAQNIPTKILHDITVVDVRTGKERTHQDVLIDGKNIASISPSRKEARAGATVLHTGGYVIPGLWDMHVHLAGVLAEGRWSRDTLLPQLLQYGITSVRDMGGDVGVLKVWRAARDSGSLQSPYIAFSGPMLTVVDTHSYDSRTVRTAEDARNLVNELTEQNVDFIKILHIPRAAYFPLAAYTREQGITFVGHLPYGVTIEEAAEAGQKSIEHVNWSVLALDCSSDPKHFREDLVGALQSKEKGGYDRVLDDAATHFDSAHCAAASDAMRTHGAVLVPTLVAEEIASKVGEAPVDPEYLQLLPDSLRKGWTADNLNRSISPEQRAWLKRQWNADLKIATFMREHGVAMLPGSDSLDVGNLPGPSLHRELQLFVQIGFSPAEALRAATLDSATFLGKAETMGTVEPGKVADLVVLCADPLHSIENTATVQLVLSKGELVPNKRVLSCPSSKSSWKILAGAFTAFGRRTGWSRR
jgi:Amidohydrolase family